MIPEPMNPAPSVLSPGTDRFTAELMERHAVRALREQLERRELMGQVARDKARHYVRVIRNARKRLAS